MNLLEKYSIDKADLNDKLRRFVDAYLDDPNPSRAAIAAGFPASQARRIGQIILARPKVQAYLNEQRANLAERNAIGKDYIVAQLLAIHRRCMQAEPVLDREGRQTGQYKFDPSNAIKALREVATLCGFYDDPNRQNEVVVQVRSSFSSRQSLPNDQADKQSMEVEGT
jgi:phage terminase small subunit